MEFGRVTYWLQTLRSWRRWTHRNLLKKTQCERRDISPKRRIYFSNSRWTNQNTRRRSGTENIHLDTAATQVEERVTLTFLENQKDLFTNSWLTSGCRWSYKRLLVHVGSFIYRHHVEPRVALYSPREESFPIPLKYIDVTRTTRTNLDVKQVKRIDDYWNIDGSRDLSDPWTGFTQFTLLDEEAPDGYTWSGGRLTRKQLTSKPDHLWPELWKSMGKNAKLKEKAKVVWRKDSSW